MPTREAACSCGQLRLAAEGDPVRVSVCHCLACQRRTGSAFGYQARFPAERVRVAGRSTEYVRTSDEGEERTFRFCPDRGATVFYALASDYWREASRIAPRSSLRKLPSDCCVRAAAGKLRRSTISRPYSAPPRGGSMPTSRNDSLRSRL